MDKINEEIEKFLEEIKILDIFTGKDDKKLMESMVDIRYKVTHFQFQYIISKRKEKIIRLREIE